MIRVVRSDLRTSRFETDASISMLISTLCTRRIRDIAHHFVSASLHRPPSSVRSNAFIISQLPRSSPQSLPPPCRPPCMSASSYSPLSSVNRLQIPQHIPGHVTSMPFNVTKFLLAELILIQLLIPYVSLTNSRRISRIFRAKQPQDCLIALHAGLICGHLWCR